MPVFLLLSLLLRLRLRFVWFCLVRFGGLLMPGVWCLM
jgi:hypothetical protein